MELSIVLVIIGLLVGGVMAGRSLIRAAELRSVSADVSHYLTATHAFRGKYLGLPGDINNATAFWGIAAGTTGDDRTCQDAVSTDARTCNGNADGRIIGYESFRYWQHLANAGLIAGQFTGRGVRYTPDGTQQAYCYGGSYNCQQMRLRPASIMPKYTSQGTSSADFLPIPPANYYLVGNRYIFGAGTVPDNPYGAILTTQEAWNIDMKTDDGLPNSGTIRTNYKQGATASWTQDVNQCSSGNDPDSPYNFSREGLSCAFRIDMKL